MAVTISQSPSLYTPSDNPVLWVFSSDQTAQPNFSFIVELYVDGVLDTSHQVFPDNGIYAKWDASESILPLISPAALQPLALASDAGNYRAVYIKVYERYGSPAVNHSSATSQTRYPFKACLSEEEFEVFTPQQFSVASSSRRFFTDSGNETRVYDSSDYYLQIITSLASNLVLDVKMTDTAGDPVAAFDIPISNTVRITQFSIGKKALIASGISEIQYAATTRVSVYVRRTTDDAVMSETIAYSIDRHCATEVACVIWLNKYGAFDQFSFSHNVIYSSEVSRKQFQRQFGNWVGSTWTYDASRSGQVSYHTVTENFADLVSDWLTQQEQNWLTSLYGSVLTYIQRGTKYMRVPIQKANYVFQQEDYEDLFNEVARVSFSNKRNSVTL